MYSHFCKRHVLRTFPVMIKLDVKSVGKHFSGRWIFRDITFEVTGGVYGVGGKNGSGKSTLMRCLSGLHRPDAGSVSWLNTLNSEEITSLRDISGYAAPYINLYGELSVAENFILMEAGRQSMLPEKASELLSACGLEEKRDSPYKLLSSGQQQRVKLIAAVQSSPQILFLDEPGTNLDVFGSEFVRQIISGRRESGFLTFLASNDSSELDLCDDVYHLN